MLSSSISLPITLSDFRLPFKKYSDYRSLIFSTKTFPSPLMREGKVIVLKYPFFHKYRQLPIRIRWILSLSAHQSRRIRKAAMIFFHGGHNAQPSAYPEKSADNRSKNQLCDNARILRPDHKILFGRISLLGICRHIRFFQVCMPASPAPSARHTPIAVSSPHADKLL